MAGDLFKRASAYTKKHPRTSFQDAIKLLSKKKPAKKKAAARKKVAGVKKAAKVKVSRSKTGKTKLTIGNISLTEISRLQGQIETHEREIERLKNEMAGMEAVGKVKQRRHIEKRKGLISDIKKHLRSLKKYI